MASAIDKTQKTKQNTCKVAKSSSTVEDCITTLLFFSNSWIIGLFLSGGFDSRAMLGLLMKNNNFNKIKTFSYGHNECDDVIIAKDISKIYNLDCEIFAIYDITDNPKSYFKSQKIVNFTDTWFFHDEVKKPLKNRKKP